MICATASVEDEPLNERFALPTCIALDLKLLGHFNERRLTRGGAEANGSLHGGWINSLLGLYLTKDGRHNCLQV